AAPHRRRAAAGAAPQFRETLGALCETDVVVSRGGPRRAHRVADHPHHAPRLRAHAAVCDATATRPQLPARGPSTHSGVATTVAHTIDRRTHGSSTRLAMWRSISERH